MPSCTISTEHRLNWGAERAGCALAPVLWALVKVLVKVLVYAAEGKEVLWLQVREDEHQNILWEVRQLDGWVHH